MSVFGFVGFGAVAIVVVLWLVISFTAPSPRRAIAEWAAAFGLYVALLSLFSSLSLRAHASDNTFALAAFGFLAVLFGVGLVLSLLQLVRALGSGGQATSSATH